MKPRKQVRQSPVRSTGIGYSHRYRVAAIFESELEKDYFFWKCFEDRTYDYLRMQPEPLIYKVGGRDRRYTPDAELSELGHVFVDEVKYWATSQRAKNLDKFNRIASLYEDEGKTFRMVTERDIRVGYRATNLRYLAPAWAHRSPQEEMERVQKLLPYRDAPIDKFLSDLTRNGFHPCLARRAIAHKLIRCDITLPWNRLYLTW
ncbi:hypothetical protein [Marinimicrobium sp. C2-29]|uniref:hypothetical protein n=1 Tax=Marinimicrobium sp. C2-29 TaxID=3139825 RepID=UPI003138BC1E